MNLSVFPARLRALLTPPSPRARVLLSLLTIGLLLLIGLKYTLRLEAFMDVSTFDEGNYLWRGVNFTTWGAPHPSIGPLYSLWYYFLSRFQADPIALLYLNYRLLVILLPVALYVSLRRYRVPSLVALLAAIALLVTDLNLPLWPKVTHFAALVLLSFIALAARRPLLEQLAILALGFLTAAYVRPELFAPALALMIVALGIGVSRRYPFSSLRLVALAWVTVLLLSFVYGLPTDTNRTYLAFGQHFAINWLSWNQSEADPQEAWEPIYTETFGDTDSVVIAAMQNPAQFIHHVGTNLRILPSIFVYQSLRHPGIFLPQNQTRLEVALTGVALLLALAATRGAWLPFVRARVRLHRALFIGIGVMLLFALFQWLVIYPRPHYLLIPGIGALIAGLVLLAGDPDVPDRTRWLTLVAVLLFLLLVPSNYEYNGPYAGNANRNSVRFIQSLPLSTVDVNGSARIPMIEAEGGLDRYLARPFLEVGVYEKEGGFAELLRARQIVLVLLSPRLADDERFANDPELRAFLETPEAYGFFTLPIPDTERTLYVARDHYGE